jgi:hypothetical protein
MSKKAKSKKAHRKRKNNKISAKAQWCAFFSVLVSLVVVIADLVLEIRAINTMSATEQNLVCAVLSNYEGYIDVMRQQVKGSAPQLQKRCTKMDVRFFADVRGCTNFWWFEGGGGRGLAVN